MNPRVPTIIFIPFILAIALNANEVDSLLYRINHTSGIEKVNAINSMISNFYIDDKPDSCLKYAKTALAISAANNYKKGEIDTYNRMSLFYSFYDRPKCLEYAQKALKISQQLNYQKGEAEANYFLGSYYLSQNPYTAIGFFEKSENIARKNHLNEILALAYSGSGEAFRQRGAYDKAYKNLILSEKTFKSLLLNNPSRILLYNYGCLQNILGILSKALQKYPEALEYYKEYLSVSNQLGERWGIAISYNNIGNICLLLEKDSLALSYYQKANSFFKEIHSTSLLASNLLNLGNIYNRWKQNDLALDYYNQSLELNKKTKNKKEITRALTNIAWIYMERKQYRQAGSSLNEALAIAKGAGSKENLIRIYDYLSVIYSATGEFRKAFECYKQKTVLQDTLFRIDKVREIDMIQANYQFEMQMAEKKRIEEIKSAEEQKRIDRRDNMEYTAILIFVISFLVVLFFSGKLKLPVAIVDAMIFISIIFMFELGVVLLDPLMEHHVGREPAYRVLVNALLAGLLTFLHRILEKKMKRFVSEGTMI